MKFATMRYWGWNVFSHEIFNHRIFLFWCNISRNLQPWYIEVRVQYLMKSKTRRHFCSGVVSHEICNHGLFWLVGWLVGWLVDNLKPWNIKIRSQCRNVAWNLQPCSIFSSVKSHKTNIDSNTSHNLQIWDIGWCSPKFTTMRNWIYS